MGTTNASHDVPLAHRASARHERQAEPSAVDGLTTSTLAVWAWVRLGERYGFELPEICELAGVSEGELRDPGKYLPQSAANRVASLACDRVGPAAAMLAAELLDSGHFALPELVVRSAPTVRHGVDRACEFFPLLHRCSQLSHEALPDRSIVRWQGEAGLEVHPAYVELVFAVSMQGIRRETGRADFTPSLTCFRHAGPEQSAEHARMLGVVKFGAPETRLELSLEALSLPMLRANPAAHLNAVRVANEALQDL